ncbi:MAG: flavodoxin family protein [Thiobacillus sp.]|nr:flavodoxin family protein [Thiobacillus sp.]
MKCLLVTAHPLTDSLCAHLAEVAAASLAAAGHEVVREDLYGEGFDPVLSAKERRSYYGPAYAAEAVAEQVRRLRAAEALVLVFPTWWFGFPAILKGWFDRVWGPGVAYDHADDLGAIRPRLAGLKRVLAVTTLGSPAWVDWLVLRRPLRRVFKTAILGTCAPHCRFEMLSLYRAERPAPAEVEAFAGRIARHLAGWPGSGPEAQA